MNRHKTNLFQLYIIRICDEGKKKKNEEGKKKNEYVKIEHRKKVRRRRGTSPAAGVYLPEGRLPSIFGVPCSLFDIHLFPFLLS
jgi:hypothetical protein